MSPTDVAGLVDVHQLRARRALALLTASPWLVLDSTRVAAAVRELRRAPTELQPQLLPGSAPYSATARGATPQAVDHATRPDRLAVAARAAYGGLPVRRETRP